MLAICMMYLNVFYFAETAGKADNLFIILKYNAYLPKHLIYFVYLQNIILIVMCIKMWISFHINIFK